MPHEKRALQRCTLCCWMRFDPMPRQALSGTCTQRDPSRRAPTRRAPSHVLDECGWPESRAELVVGAFESLRERLRARLLLSGAHTASHVATDGRLTARVRTWSGPALRQLVGVDWRVDYRIRSSAMGVVHQPVYIVTLKTVDETGTVSDAQFTCDPVQLETMLAKVQDAEKQVRIRSKSGLFACAKCAHAVQVERAVAALGSA